MHAAAPALLQCPGWLRSARRGAHSCAMLALQARRLHAGAAPHHQGEGEREHGCCGGPADLDNCGLALWGSSGGGSIGGSAQGKGWLHNRAKRGRARHGSGEATVSHPLCSAEGRAAAGRARGAGRTALLDRAGLANATELPINASQRNIDAMFAC